MSSESCAWYRWVYRVRGVLSKIEGFICVSFEEIARIKPGPKLWLICNIMGDAFAADCEGNEFCRFVFEY
jgi:hypothetical protein